MEKGCYYYGLDVAKLVMAFFVIAIHISPERVCYSDFLIHTLQETYKIAVPFFFMASGFLLFQKEGCSDVTAYEKNATCVLNYLKRIFRLYILWTLLYLPLTIYGFICDKIPLYKAIIVFFRNFLLIGQNFYSWPLWYLLALLVAVALILILRRWHCSFQTIVSISLLIAVVGSYSTFWDSTIVGQIYFKLFQTTRNGIFVGFTCVAIGAWVGQKNKITHRSYVLSFALLFWLVNLFFPSFLFVLGTTYFLFKWTLQFSSTSLPKVYFSYIRKESMILYLTHMLVLAFYGFLLGIVLNPLWMFGLVCATSWFIGCILIRYCSKSEWFKLFFY